MERRLLIAVASLAVGASLVLQLVKNLLAMQETWVRSLAQEDSLENGMATHSSILAGEFYGQRSLEVYSPWDSPGQNTGVGSCSLVEGNFPTQGSNPGLLHHRQILYHLSHQGSPTDAIEQSK